MWNTELCGCLCVDFFPHTLEGSLEITLFTLISFSVSFPQYISLNPPSFKVSFSHDPKVDVFVWKCVLFSRCASDVCTVLCYV